MIVFATELLIGAAALLYVFVRQPENLTNRFFNSEIFGFSKLTALIVKSQNYIALPSLRDLVNWKSRRTQHI